MQSPAPNSRQWSQQLLPVPYARRVNATVEHVAAQPALVPLPKNAELER